MRSETQIFAYRTFNSEGEPDLAIMVTDKMLPAQPHLLPVMAAIERCMRGGERTWRLHLRIEDTDPFDVEFVQVEKDAAIVRFHRSGFDSILVLIASAQRIDAEPIIALKGVLGELSKPYQFEGIFYWITGIVPPLAAFIHLERDAGKSP